jgi:trk system potassium uptake protein TrkA
MNIVVLGAGQVGASIAEMLSQQDHNITVVDSNPALTSRLNDELDVGVVTGNAAQSSVLFQAGMLSADVCMAVTGNDEVNILAASMAKALGARRSVARVYSPVFRDLSTFDYATHFGIDRILSLEHLTAMELARNIRDPNAVLVEQVARGGLDVQQIAIEKDSKLTSAPLKDVKLPEEIRVGTIRRENRIWIASATDQLQVGDVATVFNLHEDSKTVHKLFNVSTQQKRRIVIGGGGETGLQLARTLEREQFSVMVIEKDPDRCETLALNLDKTVVVNADASQINELAEQRVGNADVFVACTGHDDKNIVQCVEAKDLGAKKILTVVGKQDYLYLVPKLGIDVAVSKKIVMARQILSYLTEGAEICRTRLPGGLINLIEIEVLRDTPVTRKVLAETDLPDRCLIVAIMQNDKVRIPGGGTRLQAGDTAVILVEEDVTEKSLSFFRVPNG